MQNKKLKAFTLPEVVVAMLLMAILFSVAMVVYMIFTRQAQSLLEKNKYYSDYAVTRQVLDRDFYNAFYVTADTSSKKIFLQMNEPTMPNNTITYLLDTSYLLRSYNSITDTLKPGGTLSGITILNDTLPLLTSLKITHRYRQQLFFTYLQKNYSAQQKLNFQSNEPPN